MNPTEPLSPRRRSAWVPYGVLLASITATVVAAYQSQVISRAREQTRFDQAIAHTLASIEGELRADLTLVDTVRGLAAAKVTMSPDQFHEYVDALEPEANYPAVLGLGLAIRITAAQREEANRQVRRWQGFDFFHIWPETGAPESFPVVFLEPRTPANQAALGFDMFSEPERKAAIERAVKTGRLEASGRLQLFPTNAGPPQIGFMVFAPVYRVGKAPLNEAERTEKLLGCAFCPLPANALFVSALGRQRDPLVNVKIYDGGSLGEGHLLFASATGSSAPPRSPKLKASRELDVAGRTWDLEFEPTRTFTLASGLDLTPWLLIAGTVVSLCLFGITQAQVRARSAAEASAARLKESEQRFRELAEAMPQIVWTAKPDGFIDYFNQRWSNFTGRAVEESKGWDWKNSLHPDDLKPSLDGWSEAVRLGDSFQTEYRLKKAADGEYRWHLTRALPVRDAEGRISRWFGTSTDIDVQKQAENLMSNLNDELKIRVEERTAQLQEANKELEAFCYSVSHDLRAPLRHVDGYIGLLREHAGGSLDATGNRYLETIAASARRMTALIDGLLNFSKMARTRVVQQTIDLNSLIEEVLRDLETEIKGRNIVWKKSRLPAMEGDRALLYQVLANLLSNAVKYSKPRDPAVIEIGCASQSAAEVIVFIRDNGVGFDMRYSEKLFGVFQRLHRSDEFEGTGIGLANVRRIIARHGGRVWAEAKLDEGATFFFALPAGKAVEPGKN